MISLLFIDPHFGMISPSLKSTLREFPECFEDFDEIEVWAIKSDFEHPKLKLDPIWCPFRIWHLVSLWYWCAVHIRYIWRYLFLRKKKPTVIQATNYYCYWADLVYFHFSFLAYRRVIKEHAKIFQLSMARKAVFWMHYAQEWILLHVASPKWWWVVSRRLMEESKQEASITSHFRVLPNSYDHVRFSHGTRTQYRDEMRKSLGFDHKQIVFTFVSLGDLERKGFGLAAQAVHQLYLEGFPVRLMFVGGPTPEPMDLRDFLLPFGINDFDFLHSVGRVPDIERYLSAADALLFPSYCEAFALVEIEAAALGLRLYLTPHYGSEMIMREPRNGRFIPWNVSGMVDVLREEIQTSAIYQESIEMGEALSRDQFLIALRERYQEILCQNGIAREAYKTR